MMSEHYEKYGELFQVDQEHFDEFYSLLKDTRLLKSNFFLKQGDKCKYLGFIKKGTIRSFYINDQGREINFGFYFENEFFTDYESILCDTVSKMNIQALENCEILLLSKEQLQALYQKEAYWQKFGRVMSEKIYLDAKKRIDDLLCLSPEKRYLNLLNKQPLLFQKIAQKHIASYLGVTEQSLSRIRSRIVN
ncbi:Crp/Fnr family transcriptional regulator [Chryseobacterium jejuense]|uniref:Fumarate/nitrate reduction transcriptional regulator n=1 Tax=Chryseobacterium jejuense TaxID=445960 RepID=A0A2X2VF42_CHRJE|nr:Crp/Fnr family transcriptional regulator [Chryseobacterium jejuense]SDI82643.1 cAMP-binding domain of CRP or a regulatory subunit of cAMP-dependent protein kinases [Chryseobacterium jejuense]SQB27706.1 fumarate/nitrate reduction transcriptional regulator [Chryseobacterium jejuense]